MRHNSVGPANPTPGPTVHYHHFLSEGASDSDDEETFLLASKPRTTTGGKSAEVSSKNHTSHENNQNRSSAILPQQSPTAQRHRHSAPPITQSPNMSPLLPDVNTSTNPRARSSTFLPPSMLLPSSAPTVPTRNSQNLRDDPLHDLSIGPGSRSHPMSGGGGDSYHHRYRTEEVAKHYRLAKEKFYFWRRVSVAIVLAFFLSLIASMLWGVYSMCFQMPSIVLQDVTFTSIHDACATETPYHMQASATLHLKNVNLIPVTFSYLYLSLSIVDYQTMMTPAFSHHAHDANDTTMVPMTYNSLDPAFNSTSYVIPAETISSHLTRDFEFRTRRLQSIREMCKVLRSGCFRLEVSGMVGYEWTSWIKGWNSVHLSRQQYAADHDYCFSQ
eukprot:PhM_4_TR2916/c0_g1_i2/m.1149